MTSSPDDDDIITQMEDITPSQQQQQQQHQQPLKYEDTDPLFEQVKCRTFAPELIVKINKFKKSAPISFIIPLHFISAAMFSAGTPPS